MTFGRICIVHLLAQVEEIPEKLGQGTFIIKFLASSITTLYQSVQAILLTAFPLLTLDHRFHGLTLRCSMSWSLFETVLDNLCQWS